MFKDKMPYDELKHYTAASDAGMSLDKDTNINYRFSLPNKLFDFMHAGIPSIVSDLPEVKRIVKEYHIGMVLSSHDPVVIAEEISAYLEPMRKAKETGLETFLALQTNLANAAEDCTWQKEAEVLRQAYAKML